MLEEKLLELKNYFFESYKNFINSIMMIQDIYKVNNTYRIIVYKEKLENNFTRVNVEIKNIRYDRNTEERITKDKRNNTYFDYNHHVILTDDIAEILIDDIRRDFLNNHDIIFSSIVLSEKVQNIQNTIFQLCIKLSNDEDMLKADNIRKEINSRPYPRIKKI